MNCSGCSAARTVKPKKDGTERVPPGWKPFGEGGALLCASCVRQRFVLRAITLPVASPRVGGTQDEVREAWRGFREALRLAWGACARVSNWATRELAKSEPAPGDKLGPLPCVYLYPGARLVAPEIAPTSTTALLRSVEQKYRKRRFAAVQRNAESLPSYRAPAPLPVHVQAWSASWGEGGVPLVSVRLGDARWTLRLRGGHEYARQLGAFRALVAGEAYPCELALLARPVQASDHRPGVELRAPGGGRRKPNRVMAKLVLWLPRREVGPREGVLFVRTTGDALWTYHVGEEEPRFLHADHVRRWIAEHRRRLDRASDDLKHEKRWPADVRRRQVEAREPWLARHHRRLDSFTHEATAMLAGYAARRGVARVVYDDRERTYVVSFPWAQLRERLAIKLDERSISLEVVASADTVSERPEPLAETEGGEGGA